MHIKMRLDIFRAFLYVHIRALRANTNMDTSIYVHQIRTKYVQIHQVVFERICWYMHVYVSICMYLLTAGCLSDGKTMCSVSICMYMNVYVCIWTVYDRMTVNSAAQDRKTELQRPVRLQAHTKTHFVWAGNFV